jgi:hypothetical protein
MKMGLRRPGFRESLGTEIDAHAMRWLERRRQTSATAAEFQRPFAGRNQKLHELAVIVVIGGIEFTPTLLCIEDGFDVFQ